MTDKNILKENAELTEECKLLSEQLKLRDEALADLEAKNETLQKDLANQSGLHSAYASTAGDEINKLKQDIEVFRAATNQAVNEKIRPKELQSFFSAIDEAYPGNDYCIDLIAKDESKLLKHLGKECIDLISEYYKLSSNASLFKECEITTKTCKIAFLAMKIFNSQIPIDKTPLDQMVKDAEQGGFYD